MKAAVYELPGTADVLRYLDVADPTCSTDGVLIRVEAISVERGDLINRGSSPPPDPSGIVGYAAAGEVIAVGSYVRDRFIGQKVTSFDMHGSSAALLDRERHLLQITKSNRPNFPSRVCLISSRSAS